jgi:copper resistance protein C
MIYPRVVRVAAPLFFASSPMLRTLALAAVIGSAVMTAVAVPTSSMHAEARRHLSLKAAFPAKDTTLTSAPDAVRLWFSEPADLAATKITVKTDGGAAVATAALTRGAQRDDPVVALFTAPPANGRYVIDWRTMSKDGHVVKGTHAFTVRTAN